MMHQQYLVYADYIAIGRSIDRVLWGEGGWCGSSRLQHSDWHPDKGTQHCEVNVQCWMPMVDTFNGHA